MWQVSPCSSAGQSSCLLSSGSRVRISPGTLRHKNGVVAQNNVLFDQLPYKNFQAQSRLTVDQLLTQNKLPTPLERLTGTRNLWGRIDAFLRYGEAADYSPATIDGYRKTLSAFVRFMNDNGVTMPEDVQEEHIVDYIVHKKKTCNGVSINTYFRALRAWFNWMAAPQRQIIKSTPLAALKTPTMPRTIIRPLTYEQIQRMLYCCDKYLTGLRDKAIVTLIFDAGLRRSELSNIRLDDIDLQRGAIKVMGKGAKERFVAIGETSKSVLMEYLFKRNDSLPWLLINKTKDGKLTPNAIYLAIKHMMQRAGITGVKMGPHTLRHSFATAAIRNGANLFYVQSLLGHSTLNMTRRYASTVDSEEAVKHHHAFSPADRLKR